MQYSMKDLTTPMTRSDAEKAIYQILGAVGVSTTSWKPGSVVRTMIVANAIILAAFSTLLADIAKSGFLELASGRWLTLVAWYVYRVAREEASFASGEVTLTNAGGGIYELEAGDLIVGNPFTGKTYRNTAAFTLLGNTTLTIPIVAIEAGAGSTSPPATIVEMETPLQGVSCSNARALVGEDEEKDPSLRTRCYEKLGSLSPNGPADAYSFVARGARRTDGTRVGVSRTKVIRDGTGLAEVVCATATGGVTGDRDDPSTDLGAIHAALVRKAAPLFLPVQATSGFAVPLSITYELWVYDDVSLTDAELQQQVATRLSTFIASQPIGGNVIEPDQGKIFLEALGTVIGATRPEIFKHPILSPTIDPEFTAREVPVVGSITCALVRRISREVVAQ